MAEVTSNETPNVPVAAAQGNSFLTRELNGASFLSLEHAAHMALVVVVAGLLAVGINFAMGMWMGTSSNAFGLGGPLAVTSWLSGYFQFAMSMVSLGVVAALLILVPALVVLDRRTRAEWGKRAGYATRLAYKMPVYIALGLLTVGKVAAVIAMLTVVITSLILIGVPGTDFGAMYLHQFVPALVTATVLAGAWWYVFKLAKGHDMGKKFSAAVAVLSGALVIALAITAAAILHSNQPSNDFYPSSDNFMNDYNGGSGSLEDVFKY